jgi:hypothetical protein
MITMHAIERVNSVLEPFRLGASGRGESTATTQPKASLPKPREDE